MLTSSRKFTRLIIIIGLLSVVWTFSYLFSLRGSSEIVPCAGGNCEVQKSSLSHKHIHTGAGNAGDNIKSKSNNSMENVKTLKEETTKTGNKTVLSQMVPKEGEDMVDDSKELQRERHEHLGKFCGPSKVGYDFSKFHYLIYNDDRKIIYCYVPKVACTQWKRIFMLFDGYKTDDQESIPQSKVHEGYTYKRLSKLPREQALKRLQEYTKIMFVREPFERVVSAYRDKFLRYNSWFAGTYGKDIIRKYRSNPSQQSLQKGHDVKFHEFVKYIVNGGMDEHWMPQPQLCQPCAVEYDLLGHYETLEKDSALALEIADVKDIKFPKVRYSNTTKYLQEYFSQIPKEHIEKLRNLYQRDYYAFKLEIPEIMKNFLQ